MRFQDVRLEHAIEFADEIGYSISKEDIKNHKWLVEINKEEIVVAKLIKDSTEPGHYYNPILITITSKGEATLSLNEVADFDYSKEWDKFLDSKKANVASKKKTLVND